ncbi:unnamed protein product [Boreogadus saida]
MGVKGMLSLLKDYSQIYQDIRFRDSKLLVDGTNLAYDLYYRSNLDQNRGGEYLAYQVQVQALFTTLADCGIKPYVVMDGGSGTSDIKLDTLVDQARGKVRRALDAAQKGRRAGILPPFTTTVFEQTLNDMKVTLVRCFGEADGQLAALAREWSCPVLSTNTDFYIYDLPAGLLHLDHFQWDSVKTSGARGYIPCRRYTTSSFCTFFNIDRQLLPVFASLAENDNVSLREITCAKKVLAGRRTELSLTARLEGLLRWMRGFQTTEDTLTAAMDLMPNVSQQAQTEVRTEVQKSMLEYELPSSSLGGFFSEGTVPPLPAEMLICVPDWVRAPLARGELGADILDLLVHKRKILPTQVERGGSSARGPSKAEETRRVGPGCTRAGGCNCGRSSSKKKEPEEIVKDDQFRRLYRSLLEAMTQTDPGADWGAGGPEAQFRASMEHLHLNTQDEEEEEEELGGAKGLDLGSDRPRVTVRTRYRTKDRKDRSGNPELRRKQEREGWL